MSALRSSSAGSSTTPTSDSRRAGAVSSPRIVRTCHLPLKCHRAPGKAAARQRKGDPIGRDCSPGRFSSEVIATYWEHVGYINDPVPGRGALCPTRREHGAVLRALRRLEKGETGFARTVVPPHKSGLSKVLCCHAACRRSGRARVACALVHGLRTGMGEVRVRPMTLYTCADSRAELDTGTLGTRCPSSADPTQSGRLTPHSRERLVPAVIG